MRTCTDNTLCWWRASDHLFCEACRRYVYNYLTFFKAAHYPIGRMMTPSPSMLTSATWLDSIKIPHVLTWWSVFKGIHNRDSREIPNFHDTLYDSRSHQLCPLRVSRLRSAFAQVFSSVPSQGCTLQLQFRNLCCSDDVILHHKVKDDGILGCTTDQRRWSSGRSVGGEGSHVESATRVGCSLATKTCTFVALFFQVDSSSL